MWRVNVMPKTQKHKTKTVFVAANELGIERENKRDGEEERGRMKAGARRG